MSRPQPVCAAQPGEYLGGARSATVSGRQLRVTGEVGHRALLSVEITDLAEQAAEAAQAFRETLQRAAMAAEALALPESP